MSFRNRILTCACTLLFAISPWALATAAGTPAGDNASAEPWLTLNTSVSTDSSHNLDYQIGGSFAVSDRTSYNFLYGYTDSPSSRTGLLTHTYSLGVDQVLTSAFGFGASVERSGNPDALVTDELDGSIYWQNADWQVTALPSVRHLTLSAPGTLNGLPVTASATLSDVPLGLRIDYSGIEGWLFEISNTRHNYSRNPVILNALAALGRFSGSALTLSQGPLSHSSSLRIERDFEMSALAYDYSIDRSGLGAVYTYTSDLDWSLPVSTRFDLEVTGGLSHSTNLPQAKFIIVHIIYRR